MTRSASVGPMVPFLVALAAVACDGKAIRLGGGRADGGTGGAGGTGGTGGTCSSGQVAANEVVWIGDSWVLIPANRQSARVQELARREGAIGASDVYFIGAAPATTMADIANQYAARQAGSTKVKVLIMDGGTWDTITAANSGGSVPSAVSGAVSAFGELLAQVASDGTVQHIIYFLVPELAGIPGVATLRPLLQDACRLSTVPCRFLDLQPIWIGHPEYTAPGAIPVPTDPGAVAIGDAIWAIMQEDCIAQ